MTSGGSLSFDRAAEYYDATRSRSDEIERSVERLAEIFAGRQRCLEVGVGTGRMALPLHERGVDLVGIDLSRRMMEQLRAKTSGLLPFPLVQTDASRLPFSERTFDGAFAIWVLHLIPTWERVLDELLRVLRPKSEVVITLGGRFGSGPWDDIVTYFREITGAHPPGVQEMTDVDAAMEQRGCKGEWLDPVMTTIEVAPEDLLRRLEQGTHSFCWVIDDDTRLRGVAQTRKWAEERYSDLTVPLSNEFGAEWRRYDLP